MQSLANCVLRGFFCPIDFMFVSVFSTTHMAVASYSFSFLLLYSIAPPMNFGGVIAALHRLPRKLLFPAEL
jgi:hypothetical protein